MQLMLSYGQVLELKTHNILVNVGEKCNKVYYVLEGGFIMKYFDHNTSVERTINFHLPNFQPFMTIVESYFHNKVSNYQIKAFQASKLIELDKKDINRVISENEDLYKFYVDMIVNVLISENEFKSRLISLDTKSLYQYLNNSWPQIIKNVPSKYIAEFMGISSEWLSKLKSKMKHA